MGSTVSRILIVDDERDLVEMLSYNLKRKGYHTTIAHDGEEAWDKIEPYYRGKNVTAEDGVGLGLSLVKKVVELHGGKVLVQSEPLKGSIFSLLFPLSDPSKREEVQEKANRATYYGNTNVKEL